MKSSEIQAHCSNITDKNPKEEQKLNNELSESQRLRDK